MENEIFNFLVRHSVSATSSCCFPLPASYIASQFNTTIYKAKKALHKLKAEGLVEVVRGGYYDDWDGKNYFYCGWYITSKAEETDVFKEEEKKVNDMINREFMGVFDD